MKTSPKKHFLIFIWSFFFVIFLSMPIHSEAKKLTLTLSSTDLTTVVGSKEQLTVVPSKKCTLSFTSSNKKVASVSKKGLITAKKTGSTVITVKANATTATCKVTVVNPGLELSLSRAAVIKGQTTQIMALRYGNAAVKWSSSNKEIATVSKTGLITGKKRGTVTITAKANGIKRTCLVKVISNKYRLSSSKLTIVKGESLNLYTKGISSAASVVYEMDHPNYAFLQANGNLCTLTANSTGSFHLVVTGCDQYYYKGNNYQFDFRDECNVTVVAEGISNRNFSLAVGKSKKLTLRNSIESVEWSSSKPEVASISSNGNLTALSTGTTTIKATVTRSKEVPAEPVSASDEAIDTTTTITEKVTFSTKMIVTAPELSDTRIGISASASKVLSVNGLSKYSTVSFTSSKPSVASVNENGIITGLKKGTSYIRVKADGKKFTCKVYVSKPSLENNSFLITPTQTAQISLKGLSAISEVTYKSENRKIAKVSSSGLITPVKKGSVYIDIIADECTFRCYVGITDARAIHAVNQSKAIISTSTYSQAYRMSNGYYDCSSLVFRGYQPYGGLLGGSTYAPTAAEEARYLVNHSKSLPLSYWNDESKLQPGDLLFFSSGYNGRYMNITHVSMYAGNGCRVEKDPATPFNCRKPILICRPTK